MNTNEVAQTLGVPAKKLRRAIRRSGQWSAPYVFAEEDVVLLSVLVRVNLPEGAQSENIPPDNKGFGVEVLQVKHNFELKRQMRLQREERRERLRRRMRELGMIA